MLDDRNTACVGPKDRSPFVRAGSPVASRDRERMGARLLGRVPPCCIFQAVGFFRVESCPTQAVLPLVGLAAEKVIRD
ncbi:MAG: hypothetical protein ACQESR_31475, partial [Planctomycetota bacterium]